MLTQVLDAFEMSVDVDLDVMTVGQSLASLTARVLTAMDNYLDRLRPDLVVVQGDTTTCFATALTAFYRGIPSAHVEAGLRTGDLQAPWPEEANRVLTARLASLHFCPTETNRRNLIEEGIPGDKILVTGNPVIDALLAAVAKVRAEAPSIPGLSPEVLERAVAGGLVLVTGHRRESLGSGLERVCSAILALSQRFPNVQFVYPVHLNPNVRRTVLSQLGGIEGGNVHLIDPLPYLPFVRLIDLSTIILTDSGGVQEEAPSLGKPVLVMRDKTERTEALDAGTVRLVGTDPRVIEREADLLLTSPPARSEMASQANPYGDGSAAVRIARACVRFLESADDRPCGDDERLPAAQAVSSVPQ